MRYYPKEVHYRGYDYKLRQASHMNIYILRAQGVFKLRGVSEFCGGDYCFLKCFFYLKIY